MLCLIAVVLGRHLRDSDEEVLTPEKVPDKSVADKKPVVVARSFCASVLTAIQKKQSPYWNPQTEKCNEESRAELISQCNVLVRGFGDKIGELCPKDEPPCKDECDKDKMKPVKYLIINKPTLPNETYAAFPEPANAGASRRMAEGQQDKPALSLCKDEPCGQPEIPKAATTEAPKQPIPTTTTNAVSSIVKNAPPA